MNLPDPYSFGLSLAQSGRIVEARRYFARAIDQNPDYPEAYYNLSEYLVAITSRISLNRTSQTNH